MERLEGSDMESLERWWWAAGRGGFSAELARWERSEGSEVVNWERWGKRGVVRSWQGGKGARVVR